VRTSRFLQPDRRWVACRHAGAATIAGLAAPTALAATEIGESAALLVAVGVGALIAISTIFIAKRVRGDRELRALRRTLSASADWWWRTDTTLKVIKVGAGQRQHPEVDPRRLIGRAPWEIGDGKEAPASLAQATAPCVHSR
jgi:hypothetical protein